MKDTNLVQLVEKTTYSVTQPYLELKADADWEGYFTTDFFVLHHLSKEKFIKLKKNEKDWLPFKSITNYVRFHSSPIGVVFDSIY